MIILCEIQCAGFEHAEVNAAFINVFRLEYPNKKIKFFGEKKHILNIKNILKKHNINYINFIEIEIPKRNSSNIARFNKEFKLVKKLFQCAAEYKQNKIFFCSITSAGLISIKYFSKYFKKINSYIILHSILETVFSGPSLKPWETIFWFRFPLTLFDNKRIKYIVLSESIKKELVFRLPGLKKYIYSINLPYYFKKPAENDNKKITFGYIGVGVRKKGINLFIDLAKIIKSSKYKKRANFKLVGYIGERNIKTYSRHVINISNKKPLNENKFKKEIQSIDYALFLYKPEAYNFTASAALFDAFSYLKPVIAIRNPYFEYYFKEMGDIGYLCNNYDEVKKVIIKIIKNQNNNKYATMQKNILKKRDKYSLKNIGKQLKKIYK